MHFFSQRRTSIVITTTAPLLAVFGLDMVEDRDIKTPFIVEEQSTTFQSVLSPAVQNILDMQELNAKVLYNHVF